MCIMFIVNGSQFVAVCIVPVFKLNAGILVDFYGFFFRRHHFRGLLLLLPHHHAACLSAFQGVGFSFDFPVCFSPQPFGV